MTIQDKIRNYREVVLGETIGTYHVTGVHEIDSDSGRHIIASFPSLKEAQAFKTEYRGEYMGLDITVEYL